MAYEIENFDPSANDAVTGLRGGYGKPNFPPNYDAGQKIDAVGYGEELAFGSDLLDEPMREPSSVDPAAGWDNASQRISEE